MADVNYVVLVGRLTRDASLKFTNSGLPICEFSLAINRRVRQGEVWTDEAHFFDITLFGKQGEAIAQYMTKGTQIAVEGELRLDRWEQDGQKRSKIKIIGNNVQLLGSRGGGSSGGGQSRFQKNPDTPQEAPVSTDAYQDQGPGNFEDDIPF
ncbi:MAG: single-stranded DNA-binding protein [Spirochaetales bacterium]|jgi:single-strand DNA-binding protein|nr:single-stranded DNA-binding protein [Spirochaetales bacterium]